MTEPAPPPVPITLLLADGQEIVRVRLYERQQLDTGLWMYHIGVSLWLTTVGGGAEPAEYGTWVTAAELRPLPGVDLGPVPAHPRPRTLTPPRWAWLVDGRTRGRPATVHAEGCGNAGDRAHPLARWRHKTRSRAPGTTACTVCDAAEALLPILGHGHDDVPAPGD